MLILNPQKIFLCESKRTNPPYRRFAIACLGDFVQLQPTISLFSEVYAITEPIITEALDAADDDTMDVDSQQSNGLSSKILYAFLPLAPHQIAPALG